MQAILGFVLGIVTVILLREYPRQRPSTPPRRPREEQERLQREYENFLKYDGTEQEE